MSPEASPVVDLLFEVGGSVLPADCAYALARAVVGILPWLEQEPGAGVHPFKAAPTDRGTLLVSRRSRLTLRIPRARVADAGALTGQTLDIAGQPLRVGPAQPRELAPFATLYSRFVDTGAVDEARFVEDVAALLRELGSPCKFLCGQRRRARAAEDDISGYSVMLHEVPREQSVYLQQRGLGRHRLLGCGILVPHKSIRAVRIED